MAIAVEHRDTAGTAGTLEQLGAFVLRYGMVVILLWVGALKFAPYESAAIEPLVSNSPLTSWGYEVMSTQAFAILIGVIEIVLAVLIATRPFAPMLSAIGSLGVIFMTLITLSYMFSTPGVVQSGHGFPFLSPMPGQFLAKDLLLLGAAAWTAGEAWRAAKMRRV